MPNLVTPYLPPEAELTLRNWISGGKPAFQVAVEHNYPSHCRNCGGIGLVFIKLADAGPFQFPPMTKKPITWVEGGEQFGPGWYVINRTMEFTCPECQGGHVYRAEAIEEDDEIVFPDYTV